MLDNKYVIPATSATNDGVTTPVYNVCLNRAEMHVHVNGNSVVGVNHLPEGVCVCLCPWKECILLGTCILVNSLIAGVCEEWIVRYSSRSQCARHLQSTLPKCLNSKPDTANNNKNHRRRLSMGQHTDAITLLPVHPKTWIFCLCFTQSIKLAFFFFHTCMQTCDRSADTQSSAADLTCKVQNTRRILSCWIPATTHTRATWKKKTATGKMSFCSFCEDRRSKLQWWRALSGRCH